MTLSELADRLQCRLDGDGTIEITGLAGLDDAGPGDLSFLASAKYVMRLPATRASAVIVDLHAAGAPCAVLRSERPYVTWAAAVRLLADVERPRPGVSPLASIDASARLGADVSVGPFAVIGPDVVLGARVAVEAHAIIGARARVGDDTWIRAQASVRAGVEIGARVIVQDGAVIGAEGYGFAQGADGAHHKIPQTGRVVIEDDVEIGAQTVVDRPAVGETRIGAGTKIDNLVQVAHGVHIGRHVLMAAQSGIAGSTSVGDHAVMAGQSGATGHIHIGRGVVVGAKSVVTKDIEPGKHVTGIPAVEVSEWREAVALARRLPDLRRQVQALEARLAALEARTK